MIYGHDKTIHHTELVNVEVDPDGKVVSVWFRCMALPFDQTVVSYHRAAEMQVMSERINKNRLVAVEVIQQ